ncbi:hypothetical protein DV704_01975 [Meiothermus sp. QL-1]|uniref:hypothetical protein n=1 Tax=Meiothermus sp. QL-1 TaxID=2058095 RepID=UPI000E09EA7B|nr:hypothetical protein [Meiothermus sp. QL-1]RDI96603.1 hypothetical protein DV704_01975 [Meiothermus sp. QL-1]
MRKTLLPLLLLLAGCTGSSEEPTRALLAVGVATLTNNQPGTPAEIRFYETRTLQPGSTDPPRRVGSWPLDAAPVALFYRRSLEGGNDQLWVLTPDRLRRYNASLLRLDSVGSPSLDGLDVPLNTDCSRGYLRPGQSRLLLVCPPTDQSRPIEAYQAWLIPYNATTLPDSINFSDPNLTRLDAPARLALGPSDQLLYLTPSQMGRYDFTNPYLERTFTRSAATPTDLIFAGNLALGLMDDNDPTTTDTALLTWNLNPGSEVQFFRDSNIAARRFANGAPPLLVLGTGLARFAEGFQIPPESVLSRNTRYLAATTAQDQFLYLTRQDSPALSVIDLTLNLASLSASALRTSFLGSFQERLVDLAFIPVE